MSSRPHPIQRHNTAHDLFLEFHKHRPQSLRKIKEEDESEGHPLANEVPLDFEMFQHVMKTGVIYATSRARVRGFDPEDPEWANMGQGAPETGPLPGAPPRDFHMSIEDALLEYAPVTGLKELRVKVAEYYNHLYRQGKDSKYTYENVCIVPGGRAGLTRCMAALGSTQVGYFTPDYTAYQQALGLFVRITPSPLLHKNADEALMPSDDFKFQATGRGLGAMLWSNPANPTGMSLEGTELDAYVKIARDLNLALIADEFYSHYYYDGDAVDPVNGGADDDSNWPKTVSSAAYVQDVDIDPVLIVNGLTKNWRCPGFRICWIVAPKPIIEMLGSAGSFLDGGANAPLQKLSLPLMELDFIRRDAWALQREFKKKRDYLLTELARIGIAVKWKPTATFYIWADISSLPCPLNDCLVFLEECVKYKVICVPGVFFDINPRNIRNVRNNKCINFVRFSYGPPMSNLETGVQQIEKMIQYWKNNPESVAMYQKESFGE
eukprot:CCRYP_000936-RA/>CCRYP_000936-RA protein AED:0.04 eAED:0.04 QI:100/1/1/1/0.85/0.75/8/3698/492